ncbi:MAG: AAA family ATPase [Ardenticatenaceae bacterium]|nr:AAA family ATPase [Ardenticatenaceae bacterium]
MELIYLDGLPPITGKGGIVHLLAEEGQISANRIGKIVLNGGLATVEVAEGWAARLVRALDGVQVETRRIRVWQQVGSQDAHFQKLLRWLALEADAERSQRRETAVAEAYTRLIIRSEDIGLGGRLLLTLAPRNEQADLPWSQLTVGSPVLLSQEGGEAQTSGWRGVISRLTRRTVEVAFNQPPELENPSAAFRLELASDEIARQRMQRAIARVEAASGNRTAVLRQILLGQRDAVFNDQRTFTGFAAYTAHLNESQKTAVRHALAAEDVAIIHGPPGTGKTTTVVALIGTAVAQGYRVLACAPSNLAVDNMAERLADLGINLVRLGHPVRVLPQVQAHTLDALVEEHEDYRQAKKVRKEAFALQNQASKFRRARPEKGAKQAMRQEAGEMLDEARRLEARAVERVLDGASVVLSTLTAVDSTILGQRQFDLCVIDEAGQSTEPASWIPIPRSQRLVLAGDHQQLPPTVVSPQAEREGFGVSLLQQLMAHDGGQLARRLDVQYRMHEQIMEFSSAMFYEGTLVADDSVAGHLLCDLVAAGEVGATAVTYIDTAGANYDEQQDDDSTSYKNVPEAALAAQKVQQLLAAGLPPTAIGVITPYAAQVRCLRERLPAAVEVGSVDGFQGREKEAIIISLVRSNLAGNVGFLAETRRMNVALTRARRKLIVLGDSATITAHPFYEQMLIYFDKIGAYRSVWEEPDAPPGLIA